MLPAMMANGRWNAVSGRIRANTNRSRRIGSGGLHSNNAARNHHKRQYCQYNLCKLHKGGLL